ncbi:MULTISPECIES: FHA domain-containing protein [unclassified Luteococcus]|uniref:FHA domain-containing protein n=1 Tax=unclassified Luteococcus TaxID=2639923 RepID=UPI00313CE9C0
MECTQCGKPVEPGANFCSNCGERIVARDGAVAEVPGDSTRMIPVVTETTGTLELGPDDMAAVSALPTEHALLIVERGPGAGARYLLDEQEVTVGRHPDSDIFLDDITVSRHHVKFLRTEQGWAVADQNSLNGTYVNRTLVDGRAPLRQGDEVQIGKFRMIFFVSEPGLR